jgi:NTP pyrophosphatase (non-canonical NTP hydrolase)
VPGINKQTNSSLMKYLFDESKELEEAVKKGDIENIKEELGDVLLQVVFHAR